MAFLRGYSELAADDSRPVSHIVKAHALTIALRETLPIVVNR
jgi:hypothetical protein